MPPRVRIDPAAAAGLLTEHRLPYTLYTMGAFALHEHVTEIESSYRRGPKKGKLKIIDIDEQLRAYAACVASARGVGPSGWTTVIAGWGHMARPDHVAAQIFVEFVRANRHVAWINASTHLSAERSLEALTAPAHPYSLDLLVISGLRWESNHVRFDKIFDLVRATAPRTNRIIVGSGADPLALGARADLLINRAIQLNDTRTVDM